MASQPVEHPGSLGYIPSLGPPVRSSKGYTTHSSRFPVHPIIGEDGEDGEEGEEE
jgi:hypothetical protein